MDWRERLHDHEESPPPMAWEKIRDEVSAHPSGLGRRLGDMEEQPPEEAWQKLRSALDEGAEKHEGEWKPAAHEGGTIRSLPSRAFAYAASIAGIGLFISLLYWYQSSDEKGGPGGASALKPYSTSMDPQKGTAPVLEPSLSMESGQASDSAFPLRFTQLRKSAEAGKILLCDERGNCVAVSSKMREMVEAMGPSLDANSSKAVKSRKWNRTLRRWQKRLQDSQYLPTPGNLFDIDQLADLLSAREP
jgi:hypothetical protein